MDGGVAQLARAAETQAECEGSESLFCAAILSPHRQTYRCLSPPFFTFPFILFLSADADFCALVIDRVCNDTTTLFLLNRDLRSDGTLRVK